MFYQVLPRSLGQTGQKIMPIAKKVRVHGITAPYFNLPPKRNDEKYRRYTVVLLDASRQILPSNPIPTQFTKVRISNF